LDKRCAWHDAQNHGAGFAAARFERFRDQSGGALFGIIAAKAAACLSAKTATRPSGAQATSVKLFYLQIT
jgi:hypothetical protein